MMETEDKMKSMWMPGSRGSGIHQAECSLLIGQTGMGRDILFILRPGAVWIQLRPASAYKIEDVS